MASGKSEINHSILVELLFRSLLWNKKSKHINKVFRKGKEKYSLFLNKFDIKPSFNFLFIYLFFWGTSAGPILCGLWDNSKKYPFWGKGIRPQQEFTEHHIWIFPSSLKQVYFPSCWLRLWGFYSCPFTFICRYTHATPWDPVIYRKSNLSWAYMYFLSQFLIQVLSSGFGLAEGIGRCLLHISEVERHRIHSFLLEWNLHGDNCIIKLWELFSEEQHFIMRFTLQECPL